MIAIPPTVLLTGDGQVLSFPTPQSAATYETNVKATPGAEVMRLEPALPALARPLYDLESHLAALLNTEEIVPAELEQEYALELHATLMATTEKRDRVGQFRAHLQAQIALAHAEAVRLHEREQFYQAAFDKLDDYITRVIDMLPLDAKGKRPKLCGNTLTLGLHGCDKRAEVLDEALVPVKYKRITLTLPVETWEGLCDSLDMDLRDTVLDSVKSPCIEVSLSAVKADLKAEIAVPGARLAGGTYVEVK